MLFHVYVCISEASALWWLLFMVPWFFAFDLNYVRCRTNRPGTKETIQQFIETGCGYEKDTHGRKWTKRVISKEEEGEKKGRRKSERDKRYIIFVLLIRWSWDVVLKGSCSFEAADGCCHRLVILLSTDWCLKGITVSTFEWFWRKEVKSKINI